MPALPYVEVVARLAEIAANATNQIINPTPSTTFTTTILAPTSTTSLRSVPSPSQASPHNLSTILNVSETDIIIYGAYVMMQGIFLGMSVIFLYQAIDLHVQKRSWLTFANVSQLTLWIARTLIIIVFEIAPYFQVSCFWRKFAAGVVSQSVIVCVWWLQYIKFESMYKNRPWICRVVLGFCMICTVATFPYIWTEILKPDSMDHCSVRLNGDIQSVYVSADVFINVLLSALFAAAIIKHVNNTDKAWDSYAKLCYILSCDVRGSFLDTAAQLVKLFLQLATWIPSSQSLFGSHVCDFIKVIAAHWFVTDVRKKWPSARNVNSKQDASGRGQDNILISCRRKGSFGALGLGSTDTLRIPATSLESLKASQTFPLRSASAGKSSDSLRAGSGSAELGMRYARSSDNIMFPRREGRHF
ncbi:hypothetical protein BCR33DRAFT_721767 [Rhizoclosmatium globosum]|uniref:Uncharacterized protein n=1 Tax=Rhizoclosmatium globosum TaxID=329046 RepID=A0A1Y2BQ09_9FUNG|nr:hypothetical protein BCR33DRAFT_721767 [Rhizoclosmatium globosum]|eukprot:ORY36833.1 hypothetical protein BCR33DRAFT_721767 [Rhizoclosmatium globosum]